MLNFRPEHLSDFDYTDSWLESFTYDIASQTIAMSIAFAHAMDDALPGDWTVTVTCRGVVYAKIACDYAINLKESDIFYFAEESGLPALTPYISTEGEDVQLGSMPFGTSDFGHKVSRAGAGSLRSFAMCSIECSAEWACASVELDALRT